MQDAQLAILLLDVAIIAGCALVVGSLARRLGQAVVVGEILAGLLLGPSLLGLLPGHLDMILFPTEVRPYLQALASIALVLFMFGIGFEIDLERIRRSGAAALRITTASVVGPLIAGAAISPLLWAAHPPATDGVTQLQFGAFVAIALSVTAFPVLARVLAETGLSDTPLGSLALLVAAMTDLIAWVALAALTASLGATHGSLPVGGMILGLAGFALGLCLVVRPLLRWGLEASWCRQHGPAGASLLLLAALALCAAATTSMGLHPAFGAFALGVACPRRRASAAAADTGPDATEHAAPQHITSAAGTLTAAGLVLVPVYFIVTGLKVDITSLGLSGALEVVGLLAVATAAKVVGVTWAAARAGLERGRTVALGLLLNTRGLTELIVLDIGRSAGVIDDRLFTALVLMAILTTAMTMPLLPFALRRGAGRAELPAMPTPATEFARG
ncbi:MAG: cation:proton antiporter [Chloroflexi bacterium]|nr:cation:proton antiporter [Chloroflexota bacterium]